MAKLGTLTKESNVETSGTIVSSETGDSQTIAASQKLVSDLYTKINALEARLNAIDGTSSAS